MAQGKKSTKYQNNQKSTGINKILADIFTLKTLPRDFYQNPGQDFLQTD